MKKLVIGYFGFGKSTTRYHLPYLNLRENIVVKTICHPHPNPAKEARYPNIHFTQNEEELLNDPEIDLIVVTTPPATHFDLGEKVLQHGKHLLMEKPFCTNLAETNNLLTLAKANNLIAMPFQNRRFDSDFLAVKEVLASGVLGEITGIESCFDYDRPINETTTQYENYDGALFGLGVHLFDQLISLFGPPEKIVYDVRTLRAKPNPDDNFEVDLYYDDLKCTAKTSHLMNVPRPRWIIYGKNGTFIKNRIDRQEQDLKNNIMPGTNDFGADRTVDYGYVKYRDAKGNPVEQRVVTPQGDYGRIYDAMYQAIFEDKAQLVSDEEIWIVMKILQESIVYENPYLVDWLK